ncbi:MAG: MmcQ/YjbR family DNA-binding protein [Longimicrobiales bacterium]
MDIRRAWTNEKAMTAGQFRKIALSFPEAFESSHMGHPDFRVGGKIFATLGYPNASFGVVVLPPEEQAFFIKISGDAFAPAAGAWAPRQHGHKAAPSEERCGSRRAGSGVAAASSQEAPCKIVAGDRASVEATHWREFV